MASVVSESPTAAIVSRTSFVPYATSVEEVLKVFQSDRERGLDAEELQQRRERYGYNELTETAPLPVWKRFLAQFNELVIWMLIAAALISGLLGEWADALAILAIVVLNALLGFLQEQKAERALAALRKLSAPQAKVIRNGALQVLPARELVPGDRIELEAGDNVPADARLIRSAGFRVEEAALTGESVPQEKDPGCLVSDSTALGDRRNMVYMGTTAVAGKASAVVVSSGMQTELGRIAGMLQRYAPEATPLQKRLAQLGRVLVVACVGLMGLVFVLEVLKGGNLVEVLLLSVSLAVAAVPEGLPAVVTIALALGLQRMIRRNALIRRLPSVETLGCVTVICSDKTGTLTRNEMTVREIYAGGHIYQVTGVGYVPHGQFRKNEGGQDSPVDVHQQPDLLQALQIAVRCNNARLQSPRDGGDDWQIIGDPTEGALLIAALKGGIEADHQGHEILYEIPFDSQRKAMSVVVRGPDDSIFMHTKGAPEVVLQKCSAKLWGGKVEPLSEADRRHIMDRGADMASRALRVLAFAYRAYPEAHATHEEENLVFVGLAGMIDPPREEAREAVRKCHAAGIRPIMITGDHPATALAIGRELDIATVTDGVVTGQDLDALSDEELVGQLERTSIYARVAAEHKLRLVRALKSAGQVVAMTGDGINDAPAVKAADIGIAMGLTGTDVTKEASDMVLTDDNFASIVNAVEEGRGIYDNIQKFMQYLLAGNTGLILFVLFAHLAGWPFPLITIQILWINLVTNGLPALALGLEPPEPDLMKRKPRPPRDPVLTLRQGLVIFLHGSFVAVATALAFALVYQGEEAHVPRARTMAFCVISFSFVFYSFACRSQRYTMPELGFFTNPALFAAVAISCLLQLSVVMLPFAQEVFEAVTHLGWEWLLILGFSLMPPTIVETYKLLRKRWTGTGTRKVF